ncbi:MAG TPA: lipoate--protein ligase family protein [Actinomycetota bacterium]|jgi:lipoate-protein ligase A|nr:lipoate--protein ligase family protein [Actinomycetota bacterium]
MERRTIRIVRDHHPEPPALDTAIARATLDGVAHGDLPETLRLHRPAAVVAFGPRDRVAARFLEAVAAAEDNGFAAVERLAGGRAAVFHEGTIAFSWAIPLVTPRDGIRDRFDEIAGVMAEALAGLGVEARIGEVPGEYCPGEHSVNARGRSKLMGVGQRIVSGAAHVGGVVVVSGADRVRTVLLPVYEALDLAWDPSTAGAIEDEVPGIGWDDVEAAILDRFAERHDLRVPTATPPDVLARATALIPRHAIDATAAG